MGVGNLPGPFSPAAESQGRFPSSPALTPHLVVCPQLEQTRDRAASRERSMQSKILDLETQLSRTKSEISQLRRSKDDVSPSSCGAVPS